MNDVLAFDPHAGARRVELAARLAQVQARVEAGCRAAGRVAGEITLVVVTKTFPASDAEHLVSLGVRDLGESRDQEAAAKVVQVGDAEVRWHFIGRLQRNKAASVARYAHVVHSLDREALVGPLERGAAAAGRRPLCLVQVSIDGDPERGGVVPDDVPRLAEAVAASTSLRLGGVMAVAPPQMDPAAAFSVLEQVAAGLRQQHPAATIVSAGMSNDLEAALAHGATHLRVGGAVLGGRPPLR